MENGRAFVVMSAKNIFMKIVDCSAILIKFKRKLGKRSLFFALIQIETKKKVNDHDHFLNITKIKQTIPKTTQKYS